MASPTSSGGVLPSLFDLLNKSTPAKENQNPQASLNNLPSLSELLQNTSPLNLQSIKNSCNEKPIDEFPLSDGNVQNSTQTLLNSNSAQGSLVDGRQGSLLDLLAKNQTKPITGFSSDKSSFALADIISKHNNKNFELVKNTDLLPLPSSQCTSAKDDKLIPSLADLLSSNQTGRLTSVVVPLKQLDIQSVDKNNIISNSFQKLSLSDLADKHFSNSYFTDLQNCDEKGKCRRIEIKKSVSRTKDKQLFKSKSLFSKVFCKKLVNRRKLNVFDQTEKFDGSTKPFNVVIMKKIIVHSDKMKPIFEFNTQSPDDIVKFHQKKSYERDGLFK